MHFRLSVTMIVGLVAPTSVALVGLPDVRQPACRECWCVEYAVSQSAQNDAGEPDHAAAWYYDFFPYAGGSRLLTWDTLMIMAIGPVCICDGFHRRSISCKVFESVPEIGREKINPMIGGCRDFCVPDVITGSFRRWLQQGGSGRIFC